MAAAPTAEQRRHVADRTLGNDGTLADLEAAVDELWPWLRPKNDIPKPLGLSPTSAQPAALSLLPSLSP